MDLYLTPYTKSQLDMDLGYLNLRDKVRKLLEKKHNGKSLYDLEFGSIFLNKTKNA